jgi:hypothetical protein
MKGLFNLLKEAERIERDIKFTKIYEAYNAADLRKDNINGYNANTQSFRQYIKEIMDLLSKLNAEMEKIFKTNQSLFNRNANIDNFVELEKSNNIKLSKELSYKYLKIEYKLFLCIKVFYRIFNIFKGLPLNIQSRLSNEMISTKGHLIKVITAIKNEFKTQQELYGCIHNYAGNIISVEKADNYFTLDNLKNHFQKGIDILGEGSSNYFVKRYPK